MSLTRKHLILEVNEDSVLNYDYHYELMKRIYEAIELKDKSKALSLHNKGYEIDNKRFKLFNYNLFCQDAIYSNKGIEIKKDNPIKLIISGYSEVINLILKGFIIKQKFTLDNIEFKIVNIEDDKKIKLNNMHDAILKFLSIDGNKVVFRPDSGEPVSTTIDCLNILESGFGSYDTESGYKVFDANIGLLWGD
ncbi:MAG: hypothetical protein J6D47_15400, partial [Peptostreptococcaceae bacterium]|nr:hypothetical protein [Peptostreptococcaceae bacterium]